MNSLPKCDSYWTISFVPTEVHTADRTFGASDHGSLFQDVLALTLPAFRLRRVCSLRVEDSRNIGLELI